MTFWKFLWFSMTVRTMNFIQKSFSFIFFAHGWARSDVKERVVWVDTTKTKVKDKEGKLKEKETTVLEVLGDKSGCCLTTGWQSLKTNFFFSVIR